MSDYKVGDVVLVKLAGWGFPTDDVGKYAEIVEISDYIGYEDGVKVKSYDEQLKSQTAKVGAVGVASFGDKPLILLNTKEKLILEEHPLESYPTKAYSSEERQLVGKKFQVHGLGDVYKVIGLQDGKYHIVNDSTPTDTECGKHTKEAVYRYFDEGTWVFLDKNQVEDVKPTKSDDYTVDHYSTFYKLTDKDIEAGEIKVDAYWVAKQWKTGSRDDSGALWHSLKTIARFGDKNCKAREIKALYNQAIALARIYEVDLSE